MNSCKKNSINSCVERYTTTGDFHGCPIVESFAPDKLEIVLDASAGSRLKVGDEFKPSDLQLSVGGAISDDDAIIVVEESAGGGKKLVIKSKTGASFAAADVAGPMRCRCRSPSRRRVATRYPWTSILWRQ